MRYSRYMKAFIAIVLIVALAAGVAWYFFRPDEQIQPVPQNVLSFEDCVRAGYPVMESNPRQCKTPDGRTYAEEPTEEQLAAQIVYKNATANNIVVTNPTPGAVTGKSFTVTGKARGPWYFEASFPVRVLDKDGKQLAIAVAQAQGEWMTTEFVPFSVNITVPQSYIGPATLELQKDNPSGLPENDASISFPFTIEY